MDASPPTSQPPPTFREAASAFGQWCVRRPLDAFLLIALIGVTVYFYCGYKYALSGQQSTFAWAAAAWNTENDLEHGALIFPAAVIVAWMHRARIRDMAKRGSAAGLIPVLGAVLAFLSAVWTGHARIAIASFPLLVFGAVWFLWGWGVARQIAFACALCLFMVPVGFLLGHTEPLQRLVAVVVEHACALLRLGIDRDGVRLLAMDGSFQCEVAGGCSGIRSLMAMTLLSAVYVHFTQESMWKKVLIFVFTLPFAVIGNIARVFTIILVCKFISPTIGTGVYHDVSGFLVTIPIALSGMLALSSLLNRDWGFQKTVALKPEQIPAVPASGERRPSPSPISYDY